MKIERRLTFGRDTGTNFDIWLLDDHATFHGSATSSTILRSKQPLAVRLCESLDRNDTDTGLVVAAITWTESHTPSGL